MLQWGSLQVLNCGLKHIKISSKICQPIRGQHFKISSQISLKSCFLPFSQKSKMADMVFFGCASSWDLADSEGIIYFLVLLSVSRATGVDTHTHIHTRRIAYYCPAWEVARAGENSAKRITISPFVLYCILYTISMLHCILDIYCNV